ncbi:MAG: hypothetical protein ACYTEQ_00780 [Planctomycetota bacterium]|jgi:hypothetical protein
MPDVSTGEFAGLSESQQKRLREYLDNRDDNMDFARPYFRQAVRMYGLYAGRMPQEIEATFSQVMLWYAYAIVKDELGPAMRAWATRDDAISLEANDIHMEPHSETAEKWIRYQMYKQQKIGTDAEPSVEGAFIFGNGYRFYSHMLDVKMNERREPNFGPMGILDPENPMVTIQTPVERNIITGNPVNFFNVLPSRNGSLINPPVHLSERGLDNMIIYFYMPDSMINAEVKKGNFNADQAARLLQQAETEITDHPSAEFKFDIASTDPGWQQFMPPSSVRGTATDSKQVQKRRLVGLFLQRDKWMFVGNHQFLLYDGPPINDFWPLAVFQSQTNIDDFFGTSLLRPVEDLILSIILNYNMRLDYLAEHFHPTKYIPQKMVDDLGGDIGRFDPAPYNLIPYNHREYPRGLDGRIFTDKPDSLDQQAFLEQGQMDELIERFIGRPDGKDLAGSTAAVGSQLISSGAARSMARAVKLDLTGFSQCIDLTFKFGKKYVNETQHIRTGADGLPWEKIDHNAITDGYGIVVNGASKLLQVDEMFKKQLSILPAFINDPELRGRKEMKRQTLEQAYDNVDVIINGTPSESPVDVAMQNAQAGQPGGVPSFQNDAQGASGAAGSGAPSFGTLV